MLCLPYVFTFLSSLWLNDSSNLIKFIVHWHVFLDYLFISRPAGLILQAPQRDFGGGMGEVGGERGAKVRGLDDILEVGEMSLDDLDSDTRANSSENIRYRHSNFTEVTLCH